MRRAVAAALLLALAAARAGGAPEDGTPDGGPAPAARPDGGQADPDQELIDHLDEIRDLDLLRNLELFDTGDDGR